FVLWCCCSQSAVGEPARGVGMTVTLSAILQATRSALALNVAAQLAARARCERIAQVHAAAPGPLGLRRGDHRVKAVLEQGRVGPPRGDQDRFHRYLAA